MVLDRTLLSDFLDGTDSARRFLQQYQTDGWAGSLIVLYEAYMVRIRGDNDGPPGVFEQAVRSSMDVLDVTAWTANEAASIQDELVDRGILADHPDARIAASAQEHGGTFAPAEKHFWTEDARSVLIVAENGPA